MPYFFRKFAKMSQNLSSAAVVIGALRVKHNQREATRGKETHNNISMFIEQREEIIRNIFNLRQL